jgi:hypothetical protein
VRRPLETLLPLGLVVVFSALHVACSNEPTPTPDRLPFDLAIDLLDADRASVPSIIRRRYPTSTRIDGALGRFRIDGPGPLAEVFVFADVRSGRVSSVVLKFRKDVDDSGRRRLLVAAGAPEAARSQPLPELTESVTSIAKQRRLRIRRADKNGQFTITVE